MFTPGRGQYLLAPSKEKAGAKVEAAGAKSLGERDAEPLGCDIIHSVTNPLSRVTGAIHVYGGDFFSVSRSEWDPETLLERNYDMEKKSAPVRGSEPGLRQFMTTAIQSSASILL